MIRPMRSPSFLRRLPRYPLEVFFWTRLLIWGATLLAYLVFEAQYAQPLHAANGAEDVVQHDVGWAIDVWGRWDSGWFVGIAQHGYSDPGHSTAFFPLYPLLIRFVGWFLLGHHLLAGVLISLAASAVAFVLLWKLVDELRGEVTAGRTVLYLAVFPTTLFLIAVYSESLYLMLSVAAFLFAVRGRWGWAGIATGLAALTRVSGVMLVPALAVLAWRATNRRSALVRLAVSLPIMALWPLYLGLVHGRPFVFLSAQRAGWDRHLSDAGPLGGAWDALVEGWRGVRQLVAGSGHNYFPNPDHGAMYGAGLNLEQLAYAVLLVALGIYAWKALGAAYGIFVLGSLALPFSDPLPGTPLLSMPRFALGVFPVFVALGLLGARPRVNTALVATFAVLLGVNLARWVLWIWVA
jgi:Mannosyltransferase (PIG-V)